MLFVYGTLRRAFRHQMHRLLAEHAEFVGDATIQGRLYRVSEFPGAVQTTSAEDRVRGEIYRLKQAEQVLKRLDAYEAVDPDSPGAGLYRREKVPVVLGDGRHIEAWTYLYNRPTAGLVQISSGDFLQITAKK